MNIRLAGVAEPGIRGLISYQVVLRDTGGSTPSPGT